MEQPELNLPSDMGCQVSRQQRYWLCCPSVIIFNALSSQSVLNKVGIFRDIKVNLI